MALGGKLAIVGSGINKSGEHVDRSLTGMAQEAVRPARADARIGREACGHAIGLAGARMIANIHHQLLERVGPIPVEGARMGLAHKLGGPGAVSAVAVLAQP